MGSDLSRRSFLAGAATAVAISPWRVAAQSPLPIPIIDTHIHLFDPTRPQGAPYAGPPGVAPIPSTPDRYRKLAAPLGIAGAVKVEASPWIEDNLWVLQVAQADPIMVGVVGNLEPEKPEFAEYLGRYRKNPLFRGIRCGNLWGRDIAIAADNPAFIAGLKQLADADLVMDTANPRVSLLQAIVRITDKVPTLRVVLDHMAGYDPSQADQPAYDAVLAEIRGRPQIYVKVSQIIHRVNGRVSTDIAAYRPRVDRLMEIFGEDRVLFGSDWPNTDGLTTLDQVVAIARQYFAAKPRAAQEKFFWRNSAAVYKWVKREAGQPG